MEDAEVSKSLKLRYLRRKTINIPNSGSQEDLRLKFKTNPEEATTTYEVKGSENTKSLELDAFSSQSDVEYQTLITEIDDLKTKLEREKEKNSEHQINTEVRQKDLKDKEEIIKNQKRQISDMHNVLIEQTKTMEKTESELLLTKQLLKENEEKLLLLHDISKEEDQLKSASSNYEAKLNEMSIILEKQRMENAEYNKEILNLKKSLEEASKIGKELEKCLSEETAKTNKVQEELEFVIQNVNEEKKEFFNNFQEFISGSNVFLLACDNHKDTVVKAVNAKKVKIDN